MRPGIKPRPAPRRAREPKPQRFSPRLRPHDHSTAFRRLKHKTQAFVFDEGDHYRTRLTHTLEVTQVSRALARRLQLDEDLAEALALPTISAIRRSAMPASAPRRLPRGVRRLRSQRADAAHRHSARAPLSELRRTEPDLGDARRLGQAQRPAHRPHRQAARPLSRARRAGDDPGLHEAARSAILELRRRRSANRRLRRRHRLRRP